MRTLILLVPFMLAYKMPDMIFSSAGSHIGTISPREYTLSYNNLASSDMEKENSSPLGDRASVMTSLLVRSIFVFAKCNTQDLTHMNSRDYI
jgi:hypothetical protein